MRRRSNKEAQQRSCPERREGEKAPPKQHYTPPRGRDFIAPCKCKGTAKYVHRECLDHWRAVKEGFALAHCTTCKAPYYIRVHGVADRNWGTLKFQFFVTRDILFIFFTVQLVIALLGYLVDLIDCYQKFWLRHIWGFDSELSFYYICAKILPVVKNQHLLLCTLLIGNSLAMESLPIFLDKLVPPWAAILLSVTLILMFGEILPQAICTRYGLTVGATVAPRKEF